MKINCEFCHKEFEPPPIQKALIDRLTESKSNGLVMLECPHCFKDIGLHIGTPVEIASPAYRCPVIGCTGWVSFIDLEKEKPCWGCGECGSVWHKKKNLYDYISKSIKRYPYRATCYKKTNNTFVPADEGQEIVDYESLVEQEPKEFGDDFVKG
jgi:ferredoxin